VFVLYDAFGTVDMPANHRDEQRAAGIIVEPFRPIRVSTLHLAQNRSHVRGVVIDSRIGWTGGFGIDDKWFGNGLSNGSWRETNVRLEGPAVRQLQAAFAASWVEATGVMFTGRATLEAEPNGVTAAGLLYTAPTLGSTAAERFFALSIAGARNPPRCTRRHSSSTASGSPWGGGFKVTKRIGAPPRPEVLEPIF
jgi:cardiolipin synthase